MAATRTRSLPALSAGVLACSLATAWTLTGAPALAQSFGYAVVAGNFDGLGSGTSTRDEMAIAAPASSVAGVFQAGAVLVYWRTTGGAWTWGYIDQSMLNGGGFTGAPDFGEASDSFGKAMAVGDFDGDGYKDLAISAPSEDLNTSPNAGCVHILYGAPIGTTLGMPFRSTTQYLTRRDASNYTKVPAVVRTNDSFGATLAAADFNRDGRDDLVVGAPGVTIDGKANAGAVFVFFSGGTHFPSSSAYTLFQGGPDSPSGVADVNESFGRAIAIGNFNGDLDSNGKPLLDLAVGAPGQAVGAVAGAGNVTIYYKHPLNVDFNDANNQVIDQNTIGAGEGAETQDYFGTTLAAGNLNATLTTPARYLDDLVIGVPYETRAGNSWAGAVHVLFGSASGITNVGNQYLLPSSYGSTNTAPQTVALFGWALAVGEFVSDPNGGCQGQACNPMDLVIGERGRNFLGFNNSGKVYFSRGAQSPGTTVPVLANEGGVNANALYGHALAIGQIQARPGGADPGFIGDILIGEPGKNRFRVYFGGTSGVGLPGEELTFTWPW